VHDDLTRCHLTVEEPKIEIVPDIMGKCRVLGDSRIITNPKDNFKTGMLESKMNVKKNALEKATEQLYDIEETHEPEKLLQIDFDLYQMENY
jgi:hypothetical protein